MPSEPRLSQKLWIQREFSQGHNDWIVPPTQREGQRVRILQFGEGRLLRTLTDTAFEEMRRLYDRNLRCR